MSIASSKDTILRLQKCNDSSAPILSVYFHLPIKKTVARKTLMSRFTRIINHDLSVKERQSVKKNIAYLLGFVASYEPKKAAESLVFFSGGYSLFEVVHLPYKVLNKAVVSHSPFLQPLLEQESTYRHYLIILLDKERAHLILMSQGIVEDDATIFDPNAHKNVHPSMREDMHVRREQKINHYIENHLDRHCLLIANGVQRFLGKSAITGIILGGHKNMFQKFVHHLPKKLQEKVVAEFVTELDMNLNEVLLKSKKIIYETDVKLNSQVRPFLTTY